MSTILDALRKAEQERDLGRAPTLRSLTVPAGAPQRTLWPWLLLALAVNAAIAVAFFWSQIDPAERRAAPQPSAAAPAPRSAARSSAEQAMALPLVRAPHSAAGESLAPVHERFAQAPLTEPQPEPRSPGAEAEPLPVTLASAPLRIDEPPPLQALPAAFRRALPALNLDIHVYSALPQKRFVLINSTRYQQGDWTSEGPLIEAITEQGVILHYRDRRFTLTAKR